MLPTRALIRFGDIWGKQSTSTISNVLSQGLQRDHPWRWSLLKVRGLCPSIVPMRGGIPGLNECAVARIELPGRQDLGRARALGTRTVRECNRSDALLADDSVSSS